MKHIEFNPTPIHLLPYFSEKLEAEILIKRDDLFSRIYGGNKARMLQYIFADISCENFDVVVTAGGPHSNFNRACALMCAERGVAMHLVEYSDDSAEFGHSLNYFLCKFMDVRLTRCLKSDVSYTINEVMQEYKNKGLRAKYIYGGGKSIEGFYSYYETVKEILDVVEDIDYVFLACGTGTTLTGISAGLEEYSPKTKIYAISTAREYSEEKKVLDNNMKELNTFLDKSYNFNNVIFSEDFLCGGYAKYNQELIGVIKEVIKNEGIIVDPTYTGKAFYGMIKTIEASPAIFKNKKIMFLHTGGQFNFLSMACQK